MSLQNLWMLSSVVTPNGIIRQIGKQSINFNLEEIVARGSAAVDPSFVAVMGGKPMMSFDTSAIASALEIAGLDGLGVENDNVDFYFQRVKRGGTRDTGNAMQIRATVGMLVPKTIKATHGSIATASYDFHAISTDGSTHPLEVFRDVTLPDVGLAPEQFTLGPVSINGTEYDGVTSIDFDPSIDVMTEGSRGDAFPTMTGIGTRSPKFTFSGKEMTLFADDVFGISGLPVTAWQAFLRRLERGRTRFPDGDGEHVRFFGTDGMLKPESADGDDKKPFEAEYCLYPSINEEGALAVQIGIGQSIDI